MADVIFVYPITSDALRFSDGTFIGNAEQAIGLLNDHQKRLLDEYQAGRIKVRHPESVISKEPPPWAEA